MKPHQECSDSHGTGVERTATSANRPQPLPGRHVLTISLEDYFQVDAFHKLIQCGQWYRFETRLQQNTDKALALLDRCGVKATFFVMGWNAERYPEIVRQVAERGHEIASTGYYHRRIKQMTPEEYRADLARAREVIERASGAPVLGYRVAHGWFSPDDLWALDVLAEEGYAYDASINPMLRRFAHEPWRRFLHQHRHQGRQLWEVPLSTWRFLAWDIPIAGGNYYRQFPHWFIRRKVDRWHRKVPAPFVMYFNVWELDPEQPKLNVGSPLIRIRHYRNLQKMSRVLEEYLTRYPFTSIARYLNLNQADGMDSDNARNRSSHRNTYAEWPEPAGSPAAFSWDTAERTPVSVVIPCYNEEQTLPYLCNTLKSVQEMLADAYDLHFIFVDDGSADRTGELLQEIFGAWPETTLLRHPVNRGVAAAIMTGIRHAETDVVCSIDCDCTYDPHELAHMIPLLTKNVDLVTASPYHPQGQVRNVPAWRLSLSRGASFLYRRVLRQKLYTYTSCFRVYRRRAVLPLDIRETGFLGIAEILAKLDQQGSTIVEYPATLEVRILGQSKIAICRTILGHLRLLGHLQARKFLGGAGHSELPSIDAAETIQPLVAPHEEPQPQRTMP